MTTATAQLNNVNITAIGILVEALAAEPEQAETTWHASVEWDGGFHTTTTIRDFEPFATDEPEVLGGTDKAPNPVEHLIAALGSCLAIGCIDRTRRRSCRASGGIRRFRSRHSR